MDREGFADWLDRFGNAWITNDPDDIGDLFPHTRFEWGGPFGEVWHEHDAVVEHWLDTADYFHELQVEYEILCVNASFGICRYKASFTRGTPERHQEDMILYVRLDDDNKVVELREWFARPVPEPVAA